MVSISYDAEKPKILVFRQSLPVQIVIIKRAIIVDSIWIWRVSGFLTSFEEEMMSFIPEHREVKRKRQGQGDPASGFFMD
jgi:hypothetical protein